MTVDMASVSIETKGRNLCEKKTEKKERVLQRQRAKKHHGRKTGEWDNFDVKISFNHNLETTNDSSGRRKRNFNNKKISAEHNRAKNSSMRYKSSKERNHLSKYEKLRQGKAAKGRQLKILKGRAVEQVEYFLSNAELCRNTYLRYNMDINGYLPFATIFNFPSVAQFGIPYAELIEALTLSKHVEIDQINETIRVKGDYEKWLYPNDEGGFGCPLWIIDQDDCLRALEESITGLLINHLHAI